MPILETAPVDVALVLAVDCSSSVDAGDYRLQMDGIAKAVRHPRILEAIKAGPLQRMALCLVQWSNRHNQTIAVPWAGLSDQADIEAFAVATEKAERHWTPGGTGLGAAMAFCTKLLLDLLFQRCAVLLIFPAMAPTMKMAICRKPARSPQPMPLPSTDCP